MSALKTYILFKTYKSQFLKSWQKGILMSCLLFISSFSLFSQTGVAYTKVDLSAFNDTLFTHTPTNEEYDEVIITLNVERIGSIEIPAIIFNEIAYLPVKEIFDFLKIKNIISEDRNSVNGFFIDQLVTYEINKLKNQVIFQDKKYELQPGDIIVNESGLFLRSEFFGKIFGLDCYFSFRSLSVTLKTKIELPVIRELQQETMRNNINQLKGEKKVDSVLKRSFSAFKIGTADWSVISLQNKGGLSNTRFTLGLGGFLFGGETNLFLNYNTGYKFKLKEQNYFWRYVNNKNSVVKQIRVGKIMAQPISTIFKDITGVQISNTPTTYRRSFGTYTLSDKTEPGWMVELYINNVLINYTKADASGFFTLDVPMIYGLSVVKLRFFGPWGEEKTKEQDLVIPFNFLPEKQFEYNISAGLVQDEAKSRFSRVNLNYGLNKNMTIGAGMEYLSSLPWGKSMPYVTTSLRIGPGVLFTAEHVHGVRSKGMLSYRFPSNLRVEMNYTKYGKSQTAIYLNYLEEKKLVISKPFRNSKMAIFSRLTLNQFSLAKTNKNTTFTSAELLLSGIIGKVTTNLTNYAIINSAGTPLAYSNAAITFRPKVGLNITPQVQYEYSIQKFTLFRLEFEKSLFNRGFLNLNFEKDIKNKSFTVGLGFRFNFSFSQVSFTTRQSKKVATTIETAKGSLLYDAKTKYIGTNFQSNIGRGGLIISPFLDFNFNGKHDPGEPMANGLKIKINGGRIERNEKDTSIRVVGLEAYTSYILELDNSSFDDVSWQLKKLTYKVTLDANYFTLLEIPVSVVGEITGNVFIKDQNNTVGLGRIIVDIYDEEAKLVGQTVTESDGYFSYIGLQPGTYKVKVNTAQLKKLKMSTSQEFLEAIIKKKKDGDLLRGLTFTLKKDE